MCLPVIAVNLPNYPLIYQPKPDESPTTPDVPIFRTWQDGITTVREIEQLTGLDLLSNLPDEIEKILEERTYSGPTIIEDFPFASA